MPDGWPTQGWFWLEWGSSLPGQSLLALFRVFVLLIPTRSPASLIAGRWFGSASNIPTLNFAKNAKFRIATRRLSKCSGRPLRLCGQRLPELNLIPIQVIYPGKATVGFIHSFGVNLYSLLF